MIRFAWLGVMVAVAAMGCSEDDGGSDGTPQGNVPGLAGNTAPAAGTQAGVGGAAGLGTGVAGAAGSAGVPTAGVPAAGSAGTPVAGTAGEPVAGTAGEPVAGTAGEPVAGTAGEPVAGTAGEPVAGTAGEAGNAGSEPDPNLEPFSFFVTSLEIMRELSGSQDGFGGDLRFGHDDGLSGADAICQEAASRVGFGAKTWRAFLSATDDGTGQPVNAIDRIGEGPWYDRNGRLIAEDKAGLLAGDRPAGDSAAVNDLPNEFGEGLMSMGDTHDVMTGTNTSGQLAASSAAETCNDWTSTTVSPGGGGGGGGLQLGHSWPARSGNSWTTVHSAHSCAAGVNLMQNGGGDGSSVGAGGGWGAIYCFALQP